MGRCVKCGKILAPGEGKVSCLGSWRHPGLVCASCEKEARNAVGAFFYLVCGMIVGAITSGVTGGILGNALSDSIGYAGVKGIAIGLMAGGAVLFAVCHFIGKRISGCLAKLFFALIGFVALWFAIGMAFMTFYNGGSFLKKVCGVQEDPPAAVQQSESHE